MGAAAHEFGHVMALRHQGGVGDIMHASYDVNTSHHATQAEVEQAIKNCSEETKQKQQADTTATKPKP
jgi:hypothetical protein